MAAPLIITMKLAFWFRFYVLGMCLCCRITGRKPDPVKLDYWLRKALTITTNSNKSKT